MTVAWTSTRDGAPEVHVAPVDGGRARRLTHWGSWGTRVGGWTPDGQVLVISAQGQATMRRTWAHAVPLDGGPATTLPYGPAGAVAHGPHVVLLSAPMAREAAWWKRYGGGTAGKLWIDRAGDGDFVRLHEELDGNIEHPVWVGTGVPFPVEAARYSTLRAAKDGVLWLRHPVQGVLGVSGAPDAQDPGSELERYDLTRRRLEHLAAAADHFAVSGDGKRVLLWTDGRLKVVPQRPARREGRQRLEHHRRPLPGAADPRPGGRMAADVRGERPPHGGQLLAAGHGGRRLGRRPRPLPPAAGGGGHPRRPAGPALGGPGRTGHVARLCRRKHRQGRRRAQTGPARGGHLPA